MLFTVLINHELILFKVFLKCMQLKLFKILVLARWSTPKTARTWKVAFLRKEGWLRGDQRSEEDDSSPGSFILRQKMNDAVHHNLEVGSLAI